MDKKHQQTKIENFISATLDSDRLILISYLSQTSCSVSDLAEKLEVDPSRLVHHLDILEKADLVTITENSGKKYYRFNSKSIESIARQQFEKPPADKSSINLPDEKMKVVSSYIQSDGSLKMIPSQSKKIKIILEYVVDAFEFDTSYSEKDVNEILKRFTPDVAMLRRYLVDYRYLDREPNGSQYWRRNDNPTILKEA